MKINEKIIENELELSDDLINSEMTLSRFNNGLIKKYWPQINNFTTIKCTITNVGIKSSL